MARYECKYYLAPAQFEAVMRWIAPYIQPDPFASHHPGYRYLLSSLYLDSPDQRLARMTREGMRNRFKLRIRSYSDAADSPIYFEIKRRIDGVIDKTRIRLHRAEALALLEGRLRPSEAARGEALHDLETFMGLAEKTGAQPMVRVRYEREAYQATHGEPVRLTFDRQLSYAFTSTPNFMVHGPGWSFVPTQGIIFEIKFPDYFPFWVDELIHGCQLQRVSIAKYVITLDDAHARHPAALARGSTHGAALATF